MLLAGCGTTQSTTSATTSSAESFTTASVSTEAAAETAAESSTEGATEETAESGTVTLTDHAGQEVTVATNPKKVVVTSILPLAATLTVYLNSADSIVAMEPASMNAARNGILSEIYPDILNADTDILTGDDINVEAIAALEPDVVFYNAGSEEEGQKLLNAGLPAVGVSATKWNYDCITTYNEWINLLNEIYPDIGSSRQSLIQDYSTQKYDEIQEKVADIADEDRQKVLFLFQYDDSTMITSGKSFFGQWWCDAVGAKNVAEDITLDNSNATISMEQVYDWNPDVIIITNFTQTQPEDLYNNAIGDDDWSTVKAVQDHRVYKMPLGSYRTYTPGVDTPMTLEWLAQAVYPDLFSDVDVQADVKDYYKQLYDVDLTDDQISRMFNPNSDAGVLN
ncbi:MAG: ABC transporter substrate-binding protein [Lachnospiraceae bacterium]